MARMMRDDDDRDEGNEPVVVEFDDVLQETKLAWLFDSTAGDDQGKLWVPKSVIQCSVPEKLEKRCGAGQIDVPAWFAEKEGLQ